MKRIIAILVTLTMALCLFSCDTGSDSNGGTTYTGVLFDEETTLVVNGNKASFSMSMERKFETQNATVVQFATQTGVIESNEDGVLTIVFNKAGASASMSMKISGSGAAEYKKLLKAQFEEMEDSVYKEAMLIVIDGKTLNMKYGDKYWEEAGPGSDQLIVVKLDTVNKTFTQMDSGIG